MSKTRVALGIGGLLVIAGAFVWFFFLRPESLSGVARQTLSSMLDDRPDIILRHLEKDEIAKLELTSDKLKKLLDTYVLPTIKVCHAEGPPTEGGEPNQGLLHLSQAYTTPEGAKAGFGCTTLLTEDGIVCPSFVSNLVLCTMIARHANPGDVDRHAILLRGIAADRAELESIGFRGLVYEGQGFKTWDEQEVFQRSRLRNRP